MRVAVHVTPGAKRRRIEAKPDGSLRVTLPEPAQDGRANSALIAALAEHFQVSKRAVRILHGLSSRRKLIEISP
ncbi:MAG: DUF167 domain-containing protein [Candidatus Omnitrophica bacterium]|nr:DUF167 domain-containing protein [Candidatus Omnitrophota bacterium]